MSDEEFYSEESYEFEFEDEDEDGGDFDIENNEDDSDQTGNNNNNNSNSNKSNLEKALDNQYYSAKSFKDDDPKHAIIEFQKIIDSLSDVNDDDNNNNVEEQYEWKFKSYKQLMKLCFDQQNFQLFLETLTQLIQLIPKFNHDGHYKSYIEESFSKMINRYSILANVTFVTQFYNTLLNYLDSNSNSSCRLWFKININLLNLHLDHQIYDDIPNLLQKVYSKLNIISNGGSNGCLETMLNSFKLQTIAIEIDYLTKINQFNLNLPRMNQLYRMSSKITTVVTHPRICAIINQCRGLIQFYRGNYHRANIEFYKSFQNYDEAGSTMKYKLLKYYALCSLLIESELDPFQSQETQIISKSSNQFNKLKLLIKYYNDLDLEKFENLIFSSLELDSSLPSSSQDIDGESIENDDIYKVAIQEILYNLKSKVLLNYIKAYSAIKFEFLYRKLRIDENQLRSILLQLSMAGKLKDSQIDYVNKVIFTQTSINNSKSSNSDKKSRACFPQLSQKDIYYNVKYYEVVSFGQSDATNGSSVVSNAGNNSNDYRTDDNMDIDDNNFNFHIVPTENTNTDYFRKYFFVIDRPLKIQDWFIPIESWYLFLVSSIPHTYKQEISQKEQVMHEQKQVEIVNPNGITPSAPGATITTSTMSRADIELSNFNTGLLNSVVNIDSNNNFGNGVDDEQYEYDQSVQQLNKVDLLNDWYAQAREYYNLLIDNSDSNIDNSSNNTKGKGGSNTIRSNSIVENDMTISI